MSEKVAVVTRKLPGHDAVPTAIVRVPSHDVDNAESYFESEMEDIKHQFASKFPEFKKAEWSYVIMDLPDRY